jgi:hypothetical protein
MANIEEDILETPEAAKICGYSARYTWRFLKEVKAGRIPGTKIGRKYIFYRPDLIAFIRGNYFTEINIAGNKTWQSAKRKTVLTTIRDSRSAESEFKNRLNALRKERHSNMKISAATR